MGGGSCDGGERMVTVKIVQWRDDDVWIGFLQDYPDYWTQDEMFEELKENLEEICADMTGGHIPAVRKVEELIVA